MWPEICPLHFYACPEKEQIYVFCAKVVDLVFHRFRKLISTMKKVLINPKVQGVSVIVIIIYRNPFNTYNQLVSTPDSPKES